MSQADIAVAFGITRNAVSLWESDKNPTAPAPMRMAEFSKLTNSPLEWLLSDESELTSATWGNTPIPLISPQGSDANDEMTALRLGIQALADVLIPKSPGAGERFLAVLDALCKKNRASKDQKLLGALSDIAEQARDDEEREAQARRRAGSAPRRKRDN